MADCKTCEHKGTNTHYCDECSSDYDMYERKIVTNADRIRAMSDEELADYLYRMALCSLTTVEIDNKEIAIPKLLNWLQSEAE